MKAGQRAIKTVKPVLDAGAFVRRAIDQGGSDGGGACFSRHGFWRVGRRAAAWLGHRGGLVTRRAGASIILFACEGF